MGQSGTIKNSSGETPMNVVENTTSKYITDFTNKDELFGKAVEKKDLRSAAYYLSLGADINYINLQNNKGAIYYAVQNDDIKAIQFLKKHNADFSLKSRDLTPLEIALASKSRKIFAFLLNSDKKLANTMLPNGETILHKAALLRDTTWVRILRNSGSNPKLTNSHGETALVVAIKHGNLAMLNPTLVAPTEVINLRDNDGNYPIHIAAQYADSVLVHRLIQLGADPKQKNSNDDEPIDIAKKFDNESTKKELSNYYLTGKIKKKGKQIFNSIKNLFD